MPRRLLFPLLALDLNALPEGYVVFDVCGGGLRLRVVPGRVFVSLAVHQYVIVVRGSFPRADGGVIAGLEEFTVNAFGGEIVVSFDLLGVIAFGE